MPVSAILSAVIKWLTWRWGMKLVPRDAVVTPPPKPPDPPQVA